MSDSIQAVIALQGNVCLSGGAEGADLQWGMNAGRAGHYVIHWSFEGHKSHAPESETVRLSEDQLLVGDPLIARANESLKRRWPPSNVYTANLLRRNYYQVIWSHGVYGVGEMKKGQVQGGTAWATQVYMDRFLRDGEDPTTARLFFFDQPSDKWLAWLGMNQNDWHEIDQPPVPEGIWAGIGTRDLQENGKWAIRKLWGWMPNQL